MMCRMEEMPWAISTQALKTQKPRMTPWLMAPYISKSFVSLNFVLTRSHIGKENFAFEISEVITVPALLF